jgi:DNA-binding response OmpR family regulator
MLTQGELQRLIQLHEEIASALATATMCEDEVRAVLADGLRRSSLTHGLASPRHAKHALSEEPILEHAAFAVRWNGERCTLGRTVRFKLLAVLWRCRNRIVTDEQLLREVWDGVRSDDTIRSTVRHLKRKLAAAGLGRLASAIRGRRRGYELVIDPP